MSSTAQQADMVDEIQAAADDRSIADEKVQSVSQIGDIRILGLSQEDEEFYIIYPVESRSKLLRKVTLPRWYDPGYSFKIGPRRASSRPEANIVLYLD